MQLLPHNGFLLVKPIVLGERVVAEIIIPKQTSADDEQIASGTIIIGSSKYKKDTIVYFNKLIPQDIYLEIDGREEQYFALQEGDIMFSNK